MSSATTTPVPSPSPSAPPGPPADDHRLRRELGFWSLTGIAFGGMIGSGWLFGAAYAAQVAGPAALLSWPIAGLAMGLIGLVLAHLGATRPQAGGMVQWPAAASGAVVGATISWAVLLSVASALAAEASAIVQYSSRYLPAFTTDGSLTGAGLVAASVLLLALVALNWFGVRLFARVNLAVTIAKIAVPVLTIAALLWSSFRPENLTAAGGFAPNGWSAALAAVAGAGIVYTFNGFAAPVELSSEARNPRRDLPRAVLTAIGLAVVLYTVLQLVFLLALPASELRHGWSGLSFESPFGQLALLLNLGWLATVIYADAVVSPAGAASVFVASGARETYAVAKNGLLPSSLAAVHPRAGVPRRAMAANFVLSLIFLTPFRGWQDIIAVVGVLSLLAYSGCAVAAGTWHSLDTAKNAGGLPAMGLIAPAGFVVASLLIFWAGWEHLRVALPMTLLAVLLHAVRRPAGLLTDLRLGAWFLSYEALLLIVSAVSSFGGSAALPAPWDTLAVGLGALAIYRWAIRSGRVWSASRSSATPAHLGSTAKSPC
jgi:amino acid transporter